MNADRHEVLRIYGHSSAIVWRGALSSFLIIQIAQPVHKNIITDSMALGLHMSRSATEPIQQKTFIFKDGGWQETIKQPSYSPISIIRLLSWNIDFQAPGGPIRMAGAMQYLEELITTIPADIPVIIFLQEMVANDLELIKSAPWIRSHFSITDIDPSNWSAPTYGTTTLIDRRIPVAGVFRDYYKETQMDRDAFCVDIPTLPNYERILRFCNSHLESLRMSPPLRPGQMAEVSQHLHDPSIHGGVLAGDLNAIQPFDYTLHSENNLKDAYLEDGGQEENEEGFTWGYQSQASLRERFGCQRLDKILYCGKVDVKALQRIGIDVKVEEGKRAKMRSFGALEFVTDHYGLMADVVVTE